MAYVPPPPPVAKAPYDPNASPEQNQNQFVSVPTTPMVQPQPYYEDLVLYSHSPYSIQRDNYYFLLQQCWRSRLGFRFVVLVASTGVVVTAAYVMSVYRGTKRHTGGLWRDGEGQGGIDMSPVIALLAVGSIVLAFNFFILVGSLMPSIRFINNLSDIINMSVSTVTLLATICAVAYSFQHPSMNVDYTSPSPISFRKYACTIQPEIFQQADLHGIAGDPLGGVDGRALILFHSMCGQFNLSWVLGLVVIFFEALALGSVPLGRRWRKALEEVERLEDKLAESEKFRMRTR